MDETLNLGGCGNYYLGPVGKGLNEVSSRGTGCCGAPSGIKNSDEYGCHTMIVASEYVRTATKKQKAVVYT